jgi:hypothetical protein
MLNLVFPSAGIPSALSAVPKPSEYTISPPSKIAAEQLLMPPDVTDFHKNSLAVRIAVS